jgi:hypothetical protein
VFTSLWLFDALPDVPRLESSESAWLRLPAAIVAAIAAVSGAAWIRLVVHNRLEVSQVSAAGASVTLTKKNDSYFDQYLDEIVYFFESRPAIDVVVFEDLDRFNQAGIFEALRELNTLLNSSRQITVRAPWRRGMRTIRFVYALRDSIFEQLGHDTKQLDDDAAQAEAVRANSGSDSAAANAGRGRRLLRAAAHPRLCPAGATQRLHPTGEHHHR